MTDSNASVRSGVVVLAAYRPDPELFTIQLRSIQGQTLADFRCLIGADSGQDEVRSLVTEAVGDDPRFEVIGWGDNVGFYLNFERLLLAVPQDVAWVALSDQDDRWYPNKLEQLVPLLDDVALATGQARVVSWPSGDVVVPKTSRQVVSNPELLLMNQVTGSLAVIRRELLDLALPFPRLDTVSQLHDHWLAVCAATAGGYTVLDVVVQDYVQHGANVVGEGLTGIAAARAQLAGLTRDADRTLASHGPRALAKASRVLSFGWRHVMIRTIETRAGVSAARALNGGMSSVENSRTQSLRIAASALRSRNVSRMTAITFVAGLPIELLRRRRGHA